ncbi:MAG: Uncharacterized protein FD165_2627 [Gammaproteobacteria bacterium]|nr:MAG: Uncharacterized protein FD165_2627 [Gammaproteobacteria bacterium]TND01600.1 MAG: Uncharacterized protein FD120_2548 [Gammaproteobacteria bacterium]
MGYSLVQIIALIMLFGLAANLFLGSWFFQSVGAALTGVVMVGVGVTLLRRWFRQNPAKFHGEGWRIGNAVEISDPNKPVIVNDAIVPAAYMSLGALCLGSPKAGKTESVLLGILDQLDAFWPDSGYAVFEGKGDIDIYKKKVASTGPTDYFFSSELAGTHTTNLMQGQASDVVDRLAHSLIGTTVSTTFYSDEQLSKLLLVVPILKGLGVPVNLRDLYVAVASEDAETDLLRQAKAAGVDPVALSLYADWIKSDDHLARRGALQGLLNRLFPFVYGPHTDRLNDYHPDIRVDDIVAYGKSVYFHLPLTKFSKTVAIALVEMFHVEARKRQLAGADGSRPFPLFMDDWGDFFHANFDPFSARCRSAAMPLFFSFQSIGQLENVGPTFKDVLDDTIANKIVLRVMGDSTSRYAARLMGEYERVEVGSSDLGGRDGVSLMNRTIPRLSAQDFKQLSPGEAYLSTLMEVDGKTLNPIFKTRLPLPDFTDWQAVSMPAPAGKPAAGGLNFWLKYMNPAALTALQADAVRVANPEQYREVV